MKPQVRFLSLFASIAVALGWAAPAYAATDLFLAWPGIVGPSTVSGFVGDIELTSYSQTASNTETLGAGGGGAGKAVCGQVSVTKHIDSTSPVFLGIMFSGKRTQGPVTITFAKSGVKDTTYYAVELENVIVSSVMQSDSTKDVITETVVLMASRFVFTYTPQLPSGGPGTPVKTGWDCTANKKI